MRQIQTIIIITKLKKDWYSTTYLNDLQNTESIYDLTMYSNAHSIGPSPKLPKDIGETEVSYIWEE